MKEVSVVAKAIVTPWHGRLITKGPVIDLALEPTIILRRAIFPSTAKVFTAPKGSRIVECLMATSQ
jgi:hypothetical protein